MPHASIRTPLHDYFSSQRQNHRERRNGRKSLESLEYLVGSAHFYSTLFVVCSLNRVHQHNSELAAAVFFWLNVVIL